MNDFVVIPEKDKANLRHKLECPYVYDGNLEAPLLGARERPCQMSKLANYFTEQNAKKFCKGKSDL